MTAILSGYWQVQKHLQYIEEVTFGTTPTSPTLVNAGLIQDLSETTEVTANKYRALGNADLAKGLKCGEMYSFVTKYNPVSLTLAKYGTEKDAGAAGTVAKSLSLVYSIKINNVENYVVFRGSKTDSVDISISPDALDVTQNWICKSISVPNAAHGLGSTPVFASASGATPLCGTDASQLTFNAVLYDIVSFKFSVNQNLEARRIVGQQQIAYLTATSRDISFDFAIQTYQTTLMTTQQALTRVTTMSMVIGASTATFTGNYLDHYDTSISAGENKTLEESYSGFSETLTIT